VLSHTYVCAGSSTGDYDYLPFFYSRVFNLSWQFYGTTEGASEVRHFGDFEGGKFGAVWIKDGKVSRDMTKNDTWSNFSVQAGSSFPFIIRPAVVTTLFPTSGIPISIPYRVPLSLRSSGPFWSQVPTRRMRASSSWRQGDPLYCQHLGATLRPFRPCWFRLRVCRM
jgi:hypothetical protein